MSLSTAAKTWASSSTTRTLGRSTVVRSGTGTLRRERDGEAGTAGLGVDGDLPAVPVDDDLMGEVETQTHPLARGLGRHEGIEDTIDEIGGDPRTVVAYLHGEPAVTSGDRYRERPGPLHGLGGIGDQVGPDLIELTRMTDDDRQRVRPVPDHADPAQLAAQHGQGVVDALLDVDFAHLGPVHVRVALECAHD